MNTLDLKINGGRVLALYRVPRDPAVALIIVHVPYSAHPFVLARHRSGDSEWWSGRYFEDRSRAMAAFGEEIEKHEKARVEADRRAAREAHAALHPAGTFIYSGCGMGSYWTGTEVLWVNRSEACERARLDGVLFVYHDAMNP